MLSVKQGGIKYHFLSLSFDSSWDWTPVSGAIVQTNDWSLIEFLQYVAILEAI